MTEQLDDFADDLSDVKTDSALRWASVESATPMTREEHYDDVGPGHKEARDKGLQIVFTTAGDQTIRSWWEKPQEWDMIISNLVLLLEYWGLDPGDLDQLNGDETFEIPIEKLPSGWSPNWQEIERTYHSRQLAEGSDDE